MINRTLPYFFSILALGVLNAQIGVAEGPKPFPKFEAKRIKPPSSNSKKPRITVQIEQQDTSNTVQAPASDDAVAKPRPTKAAYTWFWDKVSPDLSAKSAGRIEKGLQVLAAAKSPVPSPRLDHVSKLASSYGRDILLSTIGTNVSPALVLAVISVESGGRTDAESSAGAQGLMQLMPATAERFGVTDRLSAKQSIQGGVKYLDWLMGEFDRDPILVLAGYNAGEGAVRSHSGVPPYAETRDYVPKVLSAYKIARGLCVTPPELASDGCVFAPLQ